MPSVADVANDLTSLCRQGKFFEAVDQLYSDDIVSIEPVGSPEMPARQEGIEAIKGKNKWWAENHEIHEVRVDGPFVGDGEFAVRYYLAVTPKFTGQRMEMTEMALYTVKDGKISQEEFYYNVPGA